MAWPVMWLRARVLASVALASLSLGGFAVGAAPARAEAADVAPADAPSPAGAAAAPVAPAPSLAMTALKEQLDALTTEVEAQRALLDAAGGDQEVVKEAMFRLYGWMDMGVNKAWAGGQNILSAVIPTKAANFVVGNINLYFDFQPSERWSSLVEVRFTNLPDGSIDYANPASLMLKNTMANDYGAPVPWSATKLGGLVLERAYIQFRYNDLLQLRVGQFLTPFGIWNVDHGTPTLIALALPNFILQALFPTVQIGVEAVGSTQAGDWNVGYMAYVSDGRTQYQVDPTDDKMVGGRVYARTSHPWRLQLGLSGLTGRYSEKKTVLTSFTPLVFSEQETTAYREVDFGADVSLDIGRLRLRSEISRGQYVYEAGKRPPSLLGPAGAKTANSVLADWYLLTAYRLPWLNLEPYLIYERLQWRTALGEGYMALSGGLNVYFTPAAQLRLQYVHNVFLQDLWKLKGSPQDTDLFMARIVLGF